MAYWWSLCCTWAAQRRNGKLEVINLIGCKYGESASQFIKRWNSLEHNVDNKRVFKLGGTCWMMLRGEWRWTPRAGRKWVLPSATFTLPSSKTRRSSVEEGMREKNKTFHHECRKIRRGSFSSHFLPQHPARCFMPYSSCEGSHCEKNCITFLYETVSKFIIKNLTLSFAN